MEQQTVENLKVYEANRKCKIFKDEKKGHRYDGVYYTLGFKTNRDVNIVAVTFLGPSEDTSADVLAHLRIVQEKQVYPGFRKYFKILGPLFKEIQLSACSVRVRGIPKGKSFVIELPRPVRISSHTWTDIKFELEGPKTQRLEKVLTEDFIRLEDSTFVRFDFLKGPSQLSKVHFTTV